MDAFIRYNNYLLNVLNKPLKRRRRPCLCESIRPVIFWSNITGISAISSRYSNQCLCCSFTTSQKWLVYSRILQTIYCLYVFLLYGRRLFCTATHTDEAWYVMTFGYFIGDVECLFTIAYGSFHTKNICSVLGKLSKITTPRENIILRKSLQKILAFLLIYLIILLISHVYVTIIRFHLTEHFGLLGCSSVDTTFAVIIRGVSLISPTIQVTITFVVIYLVGIKFKTLATETKFTLSNISKLENSVAILSSSKRELNLKHLEEIAVTHNELFNCLRDFNRSSGLLLLMALSSSLYTIIYNLYRYSTSTWEYKHNTFPQKIHYLIGLFYRLIRILIYMFLGQYLNNSSTEPLRVLQSLPILSLSLNEQQQVQSLILQWMDKKGFLSASGVINFGPWLLAPIVGNVVTYLLVALQFDQSHKQSGRNVTKILLKSYL